ncbi:ABC-type nitrate/sulfonate/bicarbonate transport system, substrate-binding protein [Acetitomaculum ruminis DSM 5522]|uniref:ABC-type nitrate/sulfonate/bicarbonate transport system, substrate-binding protein n=1 Tax=Acetitomaculum ruminis DSM 5522 TaxID=1120918 RepID=A0A1I1A6G7_9FIRM|nr:ABC transporter substrate-binding protein [Acetitomaculum ruminis]SFB32003.1 ABC-type nitrate/sulfonate/bicarbonate transport system, substrate-binding protein [Acetitomaculum ruminis DSM 5522]
MTKFKTTKKIISAILIATLALGTLAACGDLSKGGNDKNANTSTKEASGEKNTKKVALEKYGFTSIDESELNEDGLYEFDFPTVPWADPVYVADAEGFFEKYGLKVNFTGYLNNINDIVVNLASGNFHFACQHASTLAIGISKGYPIKAVAAGWATTKEKPMMKYLKKKGNDEIKKIEDLNGKTVAVPSETETYWLATIEKFKLKDYKVKILSYEKMEAALVSGQVDAIYCINPYTDQMLSNGEVEAFSQLTDVVGEEAGWPQQLVNTDFEKEHPDIVTAYVKALADACDFGNENPTQAGLDTAKALGADESLADAYAPAYPVHALCDEEDAKLWLYYVDHFGLVDKEVPIEKLYTNEYNPYYEGK